MSDASTKRLLAAYIEQAPATLFLSGFFKSPPLNFHSSEKVEIDIERDDEDVAVAIRDLSQGYRNNESDIYTSKEITPPIFKERAPLKAFDLIKRQAGQDPFKTPNFQANATARALAVFNKMQKKIRRSIEQQSSQVLQTAVVTLVDEDGNAQYEVDYKPKATHFPTTGTAWGTGGADPIGDLSALAEVIRDDGKMDPDLLIFGIDAFENFISDTTVQARFDTRRIDMGGVGPMQMRGQGGIFRGTVDVGNYKFQCWTYGGRFIEPDSGNKVRYVAADKVIMMTSDGRLDATFGAIPTFASPDRNVLRYLPSRISNQSGGMDFFTNAWLTDDSENLFVGVGSRPLMVPTAIDTFGCLDTEP